MSLPCPNCGTALSLALAGPAVVEPERTRIVHAGPFDVVEAEVLPVIGESGVIRRNFDIIGRRDAFTVPGDKQHGIFEADSVGNTYEDFTISGVTGDGIQVGDALPRTGGQRVGQTVGSVYRRGRITDCGRNGVAVTGAMDQLFEDLDISGITGTDPGAAFDLEPDATSTPVDGITLRNVKGRGKRVGLICDYSPDRPARPPVTNVLVEGGRWNADDPDGWSAWLWFPHVEWSINVIRGVTFDGPIVHPANIRFEACTFIKHPDHPWERGWVASRHENVTFDDACIYR